jgi:cell division protein FtsB
MKLTRLTWLLAAVATAAYAFVTLSGPRGIPALLEKQRQIREMEKRNAETVQKIERMRDHIKRLSRDPVEQELEIRERLKLLRPGEKVYITGEEPEE